MKRRILAAGAGLVAFYLLRRLGRSGSRNRPARRGPMTPATNPADPAASPIGPTGRNLESRLDEALEESFPASDPVSVHIE